jgi:hypothetical protein
VLLSATPDATIEDAPRWTPRPAPSGRELLRDELLAFRAHAAHGGVDGAARAHRPIGGLGA